MINDLPATRKPKKALLLFAGDSVKERLAYPKDLVRLLNESDEGIEAHTALLEDLLFFMDEKAVDVVDTVNHRSLADYDVVYFRYWGTAQGPAMAAARFCALKGVPFVDSEVHRPGSFNKITQYMNLHEAGVPFPKTLIASGERLIHHYAEYGFSFPSVVKSVSGTRGQHNYVVRDETELQQALQRNHPQRFAMQPFIPNIGDYRLIVVGNKVVMAIERQANGGSHLNNTSQGASAKAVPIDSLPAELLELSARAARFFGRQIAGVDMVRSLDDGRYYCFEVNRSPQIERASFEDKKAKLLARYLRSLTK